LKKGITMRKLGFGLVCAAISQIGCVLNQEPAITRVPTPATASECEIRRDMRDLWVDHVAWTRFYLISTAADLPDKEEAGRRLLQNQADIGNAMKPYYGKASGEQLTALLKEHILIAGEVIDATKAGETEKKSDAAKRWHSNADDIATFLSGANPKSWPLADMRTEMHLHLDLATAEFETHMRCDWSGSVAAYDRLHLQILNMADMLSMGIVSQFPGKFY